MTPPANALRRDPQRGRQRGPKFEPSRAPASRPMAPALMAALVAALGLLPLPARAQASAPASAASAAGNLFHEPFFQLSHAIPGCAVPRGPWVTEEDVRKDAHWRAQTGVSCYLAGKCRYMNSYLYDDGIAERVRLTFERDPRFAGTSVWAHVQRRIVTLKGCVARDEQVDLLKSAMQGIDDVNTVITELSVGVAAQPPYVTAPPPPAP